MFGLFKKHRRISLLRPPARVQVLALIANIKRCPENWEYLRYNYDEGNFSDHLKRKFSLEGDKYSTYVKISLEEIRYYTYKFSSVVPLNRSEQDLIGELLKLASETVKTTKEKKENETIDKIKEFCIKELNGE